MPNLQEKLGRLYTSDDVGKKDWIPKKMSDDPFVRLRLSLESSGELSPVRAGAMLENQATLESARNFIYEEVEIFLLDEYGPEGIEERMKNFEESWDKMFARYGSVSVIAMAELLEEMKFVNHAGYIRKVVLREKVKEIQKRD